MKQQWALFSVLLVLAFALAVAIGWDQLPFGLLGNPREVPVEQIPRGPRYVATAGTAHFPVKVKLYYDNALAHFGPETLYAFPLFAPDDFKGRDIHVLVLSPVEPDPLLDFEVRRVQGVVRRSTNRWLNKGVLQAFDDAGYRLADDLVLLIEDEGYQ